MASSDCMVGSYAMKPALTPCPDCHRDISPNAASCPRCGALSSATQAYIRRTRYLANQATICRVLVWVSFFAFFIDLKDGEFWILGWYVGMFGCMYMKMERRNHGG